MTLPVHRASARQAIPGIDEPAVPTRLILGALVTWRLTHLLAKEDGPADAVVRFRSRLGHGHLGHLMDCFQCLSIWVAAPIAMLITRERRAAFLAWLGLSGAACLLEQAASESPSVAPLTDTSEGDA